MNSFKRWSLVVIGGIGYTGLIGAAYVVTMQYALFQAATGFTDTQMGMIGSLVGAVALCGYLFGGVLSDFLKTKSLLLISHLLPPVLLMIMSTLPKYNTVLVLQFALAICSIFTYWSPMAKFVGDLGPREQEGRRYGFFFASASISGTLIGIVASYIAKNLDTVTAMRAVYYMYGGINVLVAMAILFLYKPENKMGTESADDRFQFKYAMQVLKTPAIWLVGIMGFGSYMAGKVMVYSSPFMVNVFSADVATVTLINAFASQGIVVLLAPIAGMLTDKLHSAVRVVSYMLMGFGLCLICFLLLPREAGFFPVVVVLVMLVAASRAIAQANWLTPVSEVPVPRQAKGTAIGIASVMMFSSDSFMYMIFGNLVDTHGADGFTYIFASTAAIVFVALIAAMILRKKVLRAS